MNLPVALIEKKPSNIKNVSAFLNKLYTYTGLT